MDFIQENMPRLAEYVKEHYADRSALLHEEILALLPK